MAGKKTGGYNIENMILIESHFIRTDQVVDDKTVKNNVDIESDYQIKGKIVQCLITVKFQSLHEETLQVDSMIRMAGVFKIIGKPELKADAFGQVNAPAIIFPYVREILSSNSIKAGLKPIMLPTYNFAGLASNKKKKKSS